MKSIRRSGITALTAAIALALGAVPVAVTVPGLIAQGEATTTLTPATLDAGDIVLTTTSTRATVSGNGKQQVFSGGQQCAITRLDSVDLLQITGSVGLLPDGTAQAGSSLGFRDGDIGVYEVGASSSDPNNASQCFRVDAGSRTDEESVTLALGEDPGYDDAPFGSLLAGSASVALFAKSQTGIVEVALLDEAGDVISTFDTAQTTWKVKAGTKITLPALSAIADADGRPFDGIRLTAKAGSFSLRGATLSLVSQADYMINCTDKSTYVSVDGLSVTYTGNADGSACQGFGITLDKDPATATEKQKATFHKPLSIDPDAQFVFEMPWDRQTTNTANSLPIAAIDFEVPGRTTVVWHDLDFCPDYLFVDGAIKGLFPPKKADGTPDINDETYKQNYASLSALDMEKSALTGIQFACIGARSPSFTKSTIGFDVQVTDKIYLIGDAKMRL